MNTHRQALPPLQVRGIGAWATGMADWATIRAVARGESRVAEDAPKRPAPTLLAANERRRAPDSVLLALQAAQAACSDAAADPATLPSIFASMHGDLAITDAMCRTLAEAPTDVSPTRFHNSVHNAASGYWTIGCGCRAASTAISAYRATFAQGLIEASMQVAAGSEAVLLVAYDTASAGPLTAVSPSVGLFGFAVVLAPASTSADTLQLELTASAPGADEPGTLAGLLGGNAMAPALSFAELLAGTRTQCSLEAGAELWLEARWK